MTLKSTSIFLLETYCPVTLSYSHSPCIVRKINCYSLFIFTTAPSLVYVSSRVPCLIFFCAEESKAIFFFSQNKLLHISYLCIFLIYCTLKLRWPTLQAILRMPLYAFIWWHNNNLSHFAVFLRCRGKSACLSTCLFFLAALPRWIKGINPNM